MIIGAKIVQMLLSQLTSEEGRRRLLAIILIPVFLVVAIVGVVAWIISSPFTLLSSYFSGDALAAAQGIYQLFNPSGADPNFVFYSQYDTRWADKTFDGGAMKKTGDGPCSLAMILSTYTSMTTLPDTLAAWLTSQGLNSGSGGIKDDAIKTTLTTYPTAVAAELKCSDPYDAGQWNMVKMSISAGNTVAVVKVTGGVFTGSGQTVSALYTAYYPANNAMEGGFYDAQGKLLDPSKKTCAAPKSVPFGSKIMISGTGTDMDGQVFTVNDRGGAIKVRNGVYQFDLLMSSRSECNRWGRRNGQATIMAAGNAITKGDGKSRYIVVTGSSGDGKFNVADPAQKAIVTLSEGELTSAMEKAWVITAPNYTFPGDGFGQMGAPSSYGFINPLPPGSFRVSSYYGYRIHPISGGRRLHAGDDLAAPAGTPIMAVADGTVSKVQSIRTGYGNNIMIDHGGGIVTRYAHMSAFASGIAVGQAVKQGQIIGYVGTTGSSTGNHLHFEVRVNGTPVAPAKSGYVNY